jgi:hypothetical protein
MTCQRPHGVETQKPPIELVYSTCLRSLNELATYLLLCRFSFNLYGVL